MSLEFKVGDTVKIVCRGHQHDGRTGQVSYVRSTIGVSIDGHNYGFLSYELMQTEALQ